MLPRRTNSVLVQDGVKGFGLRPQSLRDGCAALDTLRHPYCFVTQGIRWVKPLPFSDDGPCDMQQFASSRAPC